ncbi:hypothetical protein [Trebonia kvetii]|nr:hypothetical protein [Trebonia kvetii]
MLSSAGSLKQSMLAGIQFPHRSIAPGSSVTIGFTATGAAPSTLAVAC